MKILKSLFLTVLFISAAVLLVAAILGRNPKFNRDYFTPEYQAYYSSPEVVYESFWDAQFAGDKDLYAAVLGRDLTERERELTPSSWEVRPKIEKVTARENSAYIQAYGWSGSFEKIGGRWVFQNKEIGLYCRTLFHLVNVDLARFE